MRTTTRRLAYRLRTLPVRRPPRRPVRVYALLPFRDEMRYLPGWFAANAHQVDGVIAYDDGSTDGSAEFVAAQPSVLALLRRDPHAPPLWDEPGIHRALLDAAGRHDADWLVAVDADERLESGFRERSRHVIARLERRGARAAAVRLVELWGAPDTARVDGAWGSRHRARLFAWRADAVIDEAPQHGQWAPLNSRIMGTFPSVDLIVYHLRMIDRRDRVARRHRYETADPGSRLQRSGYAYLTDETDLELRPLAADRAYAPLHQDPELAVVVMAVGNPPELRGAVASLLAQEPRPEIVVVNTGGGGAIRDLAPLGVAVVEDGRRCYAGAARNAGIAATRAPVVAFLAADCRAEPGWVAARLAAHRSGERAVASAVTNGRPGSTAAWAAQTLLFGNRAPALPPVRAARYGASYARELIEEVGPFREDLRTGEDTEYHRRLPAGCPIAWAPQVRTAHLNPTTTGQVIRDQYARGLRTRAAMHRLWGTPAPVVAGRSLLRLPRLVVQSVGYAEPGTRLRVLAATPLVVLGATGFALGALTGPGRTVTRR
jgi:GT2 family glycosyltransferase